MEGCRYIHSFLISAVHGGERLASRLDLFAPAIYWMTGWLSCGCFGEEKIFLSGIEPAFLYCPARSVFSVPPALSRLVVFCIPFCTGNIRAERDLKPSFSIHSQRMRASASSYIYCTELHSSYFVAWQFFCLSFLILKTEINLFNILRLILGCFLILWRN